MQLIHHMIILFASLAAAQTLPNIPPCAVKSTTPLHNHRTTLTNPTGVMSRQRSARRWMPILNRFRVPLPEARARPESQSMCCTSLSSRRAILYVSIPPGLLLELIG